MTVDQSASASEVPLVETGQAADGEAPVDPPARSPGRRDRWSDRPPHTWPLLPPPPAVAALALPREQPPAESAGHQSSYVRESDLMRSQFRPEVQEIDFGGLFIGNLGRDALESIRRSGRPEPPDPAHIVDLLLEGNRHRRSGEHAEALRCYQELVTLDPTNTDFRFLLEIVRQALREAG